MQLRLSTGASTYWDLGRDGTTGDFFIDDDALGTVFTIDQITGNIGIGTSTPQYGLSVVGYSRFSEPVIVGTPTDVSHAATKSYVDSSVATATSTQYWTQSGSNLYPDNMSWSVGIGTSTPATELHVIGSTTISGNLEIGGVITGASYAGTMSAGNIESGSFGFNTGAGNYSFPASLAIGTTTLVGLPANGLYVNGSTTIAGNLTVLGDLLGVSTIAYYYDKTAATYSGDLSAGGYVGYEAGDYICNQAFPGTHLCQEYEIITTIENKDISSWSGYAWYSSGGAKYTGTNPANDCQGWTSSSTTYLGSFWKFNSTGGGSGAMINCSQAKSLACCKSW